MDLTSNPTGAGYVVPPFSATTYRGAAATRAAVRAEVGESAPVGAAYYSTAGRLYLKVASAAADTDWERATTTAVD